MSKCLTGLFTGRFLSLIYLFKRQYKLRPWIQFHISSSLALKSGFIPSTLIKTTSHKSPTLKHLKYHQNPVLIKLWCHWSYSNSFFYNKHLYIIFLLINFKFNYTGREFLYTSIFKLRLGVCTLVKNCTIYCRSGSRIWSRGGPSFWGRKLPT